ncbi:tocopherol cyclase family protein, partial [Synechococcus sp. WC101]|uniref:tocopherol cyclase family protein n=1 Tax=Synechococcus sp. WC101 TaxID=2964536 RepID=UPI0039C1D8B6
MAECFKQNGSTDWGSLPHGGYHWDGCAEPFFEGWYSRVTLPGDPPISFAFMYAIDPRRGGMAQVLGPDEELHWRTFPNPQRFWASWRHLALGHAGGPGESWRGLQEPLTFFQHTASGYQYTARLNQGILPDPVRGEAI